MDTIIKDGVVYYPRTSLQNVAQAFRLLSLQARTSSRTLQQKNNGRMSCESIRATGKATAYEHAAGIMDGIIYGE